MPNLAIYGTDPRENLLPWGLFFETMDGWVLLQDYLTLEEAEEAYSLEMKG